METIESRLQKIEERNARVEADKRWEVSPARKFAVAVLTYFVICLFLFVSNEQQVFLKAVVPVLGFILATLSLRFIRKLVGY